MVPEIFLLSGGRHKSLSLKFCSHHHGRHQDRNCAATEIRVIITGQHRKWPQMTRLEKSFISGVQGGAEEVNTEEYSIYFIK